MKKRQLQKFWKELSETTLAGDVIGRYKNKEGYDSERTLERYVQADKGFRAGSSDEDIATATGWSLKRLAKIREWHAELFAQTSPLPGPDHSGREFEKKPGPEPGSLLEGDRGPELSRQDQHRDQLMAPLLDLTGVGPLSVHDHDLATWHSRPDEPNWPLAKGKVRRAGNGQLEVRLDIEDQLEWEYLNQHLSHDPVWEVIGEWKRAMIDDMSARLSLLDVVVQRIKRPQEQGGLGLSVLENLRTSAPDAEAVTMVYAFSVFDQVLSRSLGMQYHRLARNTMVVNDREHPEVLSLARGPAIASPNPERREEIVQFFLAAQDDWVTMPEVKKAAHAHRRALASTEYVRRNIERLRLAVAFPPDSVCEACSEQAATTGTDSP